MIRRRALLAVLAGASPGLPFPARTPQPTSRRRIGVLPDHEAPDLEGQAEVGAFREELRKLGWIAGENLQIQYRSGAVEGDLLRTAAAEMLALNPEVVL